MKHKGLNKGMLVLRYDNWLEHHHHAKFLPCWKGPCMVYHRYKNGSYQLQDLSRKLHKTRVNRWRLKPYLTRIEKVSPIGLLDKEDATTTTMPNEPPNLGEFTSSLLDLLERQPPFGHWAGLSSFCFPFSAQIFWKSLLFVQPVQFSEDIELLLGG